MSPMSLLGSPGALLFKLTRQKLSDSTVNNQLWTLEPSGIDGYFSIKSKLNGLVSIFDMQIDSQVVLFKLTRKKTNRSSWQSDLETSGCWEWIFLDTKLS